MSGDVQPRKRKDKKRKKDELGVEEPRGTAAVFGEGDVFMHSQHDHGTGGHWCAKIIFFSLLAILVTLIGLIILENRGLTELEANSVESRYSGVLEGWLEDIPDDDHHDEHTLELKHHDDVGGHDVEHSHEIDQENEDEHEAADDHDDDDEENGDDEDSVEDNDDDIDDTNENEDDENGEEQHLDEADDEDDDEEPAYRRYVRSAGLNRDDNDDDDDEDNLQKVDENSTEDQDEDVDDNDRDQENDENESAEQNDDQSIEEDDDNEQDSEEKHQTVEDGDDDHDDEDSNDEENLTADNDSKEDALISNENDEDENNSHENEDDEEHNEEEQDSGIEVERLEKEIADEDALSAEEPAQDESVEDDKRQDVSNEATPEDEADADEEEYLELDDIDVPSPVVEHIKVPAGKPLAEVEEDTTSEKPPDTLAEEEEYEKRQEELRRERAEASHVWLKLVVGGALLVATHAVVRRVTASRDTSTSDEHIIREETPVIDRRMTLLPEVAAAPATPKQVLEDIIEPVIEEELVSSAKKSAAPIKQESEEEIDDVEEIEIETKDATPEPVKDTVDKKLYSDEEDDEEEEVILVGEKETPKLTASVAKKVVQPEPEPEPEEEVPEDVEIIDDEQLDEELEEEEDEDEEDISDVDDAELLSRLEAKYGRLHDPERPGQKHKDGGNSIEDDWPGEPSEAYWRQQLDQAEQELRQGDWRSASVRVGTAELNGCPRALWLRARALDAGAAARRDNALLGQAITAYLQLLKMNRRLADSLLLNVTDRVLDRIRFRGNYLSAEPVYRLLIRRFPDVPDYRNNLTITFLMANRADLAEEVIKDTLKRWPDDRVALAHYGFVLKTQHNRLEEAVDAFEKALKDDVGPATESRFYYHLGDSLLLLGRYAEAHEVHKRGAALGHFLSPAQRSLYNVERLKSRPWWNVEQTPYLKLARALEKSWKEILKEGEAARALYEKEKEGLKERGEWSQLDLFVRGQEIPNRCKRAPVTCSIVRSEPGAIGCRRGQVKFSSMEAGTHVRPHVGPTNCRLRMHLGLSNTKDTYIRVDQETRQWQIGKVLMFDDSFEHEVWHNGTGARLVLIVDVWHPALTPAERRALPAI